MRLAIFDLDGTLIDSRRDLADAANALLVERGGRPLPVETIAGLVGEGAAVLVRRAFDVAGIEADAPDALGRFLELYDERLLLHTRLYDGIASALDALASTPLAVLTNKPLGATRRILEGLDIARHFRRVLGGDGPFPRKPDPTALHFLMGDAGATPATTVLVGDSRIDLETARAAGVRIVLAAYGFGYREEAPHALDDALIAAAPGEIAARVNEALP